MDTKAAANQRCSSDGLPPLAVCSSPPHARPGSALATIDTIVPKIMERSGLEFPYPSIKTQSSAQGRRE